MNPPTSSPWDLCVLGLGYIGLPTASLFAARGRRVLGVDVQDRVVETINQGRIHIEEPDLDVLVRAAVQSGNLRASLAPATADTFIIAVPTPFHAGSASIPSPDLSYVKAAARALAPVVRPGNLLILESTSPVGTTESVRQWLGEALADLPPDSRALAPADLDQVLFAHCPERVLPGQMLKELVSNDRLAGGLTPAAAHRARDFYGSICTGEIFLTDARTAEMTKLTENAFRDVNIAFANELSLVCETLGIDVWELIRLANRHPRVKILQPGPGVGGHCIAVDPWFIVQAAPREARLIRTAREVNDAKPAQVLARVEAVAASLTHPVIACFGLTFKADVDDLRESPALHIAEAVAAHPDRTVLVVEPHVRHLPAGLAGKARLVDLDTALREAQLLVLLVNHREFKGVTAEHLRGKCVIDTRGLWPRPAAPMAP